MDYEAQLLEAIARGVKAVLYRLHYRQATTDDEGELLSYCRSIDDALEEWRESRRPKATHDESPPEPGERNRADRQDIADSQGH